MCVCVCVLQLICHWIQMWNGRHWVLTPSLLWHGWSSAQGWGVHHPSRVSSDVHFSMKNTTDKEMEQKKKWKVRVGLQRGWNAHKKIKMFTIIRLHRFRRILLLCVYTHIWVHMVAAHIPFIWSLMQVQNTSSHNQDTKPCNCSWYRLYQSISVLVGQP